MATHPDHDENQRIQGFWHSALHDRGDMPDERSYDDMHDAMIARYNHWGPWGGIATLLFFILWAFLIVSVFKAWGAGWGATAGVVFIGSILGMAKRLGDPVAYTSVDVYDSTDLDFWNFRVHRHDDGSMTVIECHYDNAGKVSAWSTATIEGEDLDDLEGDITLLRNALFAPAVTDADLMGYKP